MVSRVLKLFNREFGRLEEAALLLGASALVSQILALFRDRLLASTFGADRALDVYYAAFRLPDLIYVSVASLVSLTAVIPVLVERLDQDQTRAKKFVGALFSLFSCLMLVVAVVAFFLLPWLSRVIAPGFVGIDQTELVKLSRLLLFSPFLLGLSNLFASITQAHKKFFVYALSPIFYNLGIIFGVIFFVPRYGLLGLGLGVVLGALGHLLVQLPVVVSVGLLPRPVWPHYWGEIKEVLRLSLPRTLALSLYQLVIMVLVGFASLMAAGSVAVFNFAYNLQSVPLAIIGMSYSVAAFPTLVWQLKNGEKAVFLDQVAKAARHIVFWSLPFAAILIVLRAQVIRVILGAGNFDWFDTRLTAAALAVFAISLVAQSLILLLVRAYYAAGTTWWPLIINSVSSVSIIALAWFLVKFVGRHQEFGLWLGSLLRLDEVPGVELVVLPLAFSLGLLLNLWWLWSKFKHDFGPLPLVGRTLGQSLVASFMGALAAYFVLAWLAPQVDQNTFSGIFTQGLAGGLVAIVVVIGCLRLLRNQELAEVSQALLKRFWRTRVALPEPQEL
ncbi:MAG: lipid II flippase MurJ [Patescibacteria group bacterium]